MKTEKFKSILLLDDDEINNFINQKVIQTLKITDQIFVATNGEEALILLENYAKENDALPELIFVDLNMPVMDGFEFTQQLIESGLTQKYPTTISALTTSTNPHDKEKFKNLGIDLYLNKPLTKDIVQQVVNTVAIKNIKNTFAVNIIPENEDRRIKAVKKYQILDTEPENGFDEIAEEAARYFNVPIALVSIVDTDKVFFKANVGMPGVSHAERGMSLCSLAILQDELTIFENAMEDPCLLANPLVHGAFGLKFYAGAPIIDPNGYHIGTVCIVDKKSRQLSDSDKEKLKEFASLAMNKIEQRWLALNDSK